MNVRELRERLEDLPDDAMLFVRGYEGGVNDVDYVVPMRVKLNANSEWYYGSHEPAYDGDEWDVEGYELT